VSRELLHCFLPPIFKASKYANVRWLEPVTRVCWDSSRGGECTNLFSVLIRPFVCVMTSLMHDGVTPCKDLRCNTRTALCSVSRLLYDSTSWVASSTLMRPETSDCQSPANGIESYLGCFRNTCLLNDSYTHTFSMYHRITCRTLKMMDDHCEHVRHVPAHQCQNH